MRNSCKSASDMAGGGHPAGIARLARRAGGWAAAMVAPCLTAGCTGVLDPQGPVGAAEKLILLNSLGIMLAIVIPTILATLGVAWWFRASNSRALYRPEWEYSGRLELVVWAIPAMVVILLGGIAWVGSHDLDPQKPLPSSAKAIEIQVVSLDWKWLFLYPEQGIASVNRLVVPAGVPVHFQLTSATVMNSFFVPQLGSQIYTMPGMTTQLNLQADKPGSYFGLSAQFSGDGFSGMQFSYDAVSQAQFEEWLAKARLQGPILDLAGYTRLAQPSAYIAPYTYHDVTQGLFATVLRLSTPAMKMAASPHAMVPAAAEMDH
jgi:cytochrome o ubiquinol oxidase subunit 2